MFVVRETMFCKPGKVRPLVEKFLEMSKLMEKSGMGRMRVMTDVSSDRYWTLVAELEVESLEQFMNMENMPKNVMKKMDGIMKGYHELVDSGRREIYKLEG